MAVAVSQASVGNVRADGNAGTTFDITISEDIAAGDDVVLVFGGFNGAVTSTSAVDSGPGLTWTQDLFDDAGTSPHMAFLRAHFTSAYTATFTVTATFNVSTDVRTVNSIVLSGVDQVDPVGNTSGSTWQVAQTAWTTGAVTCEAGSILLGASWNENTNTGSTQVGGTEANDVSHAFGFGAVLAYIECPSAGSYTVNGTWGASSNFFSSGIEYRASAAAAAVSVRGVSQPLLMKLQPVMKRLPILLPFPRVPGTDPAAAPATGHRRRTMKGVGH